MVQIVPARGFLSGFSEAFTPALQKSLERLSTTVVI